MQAKFHIHAMEFYPEGPDEYYNELVFTVHQVSFHDCVALAAT